MALALGCTVAELLTRMSSREFAEWMAYDSIEPFGDEAADVRSGIVASLIANAHRGKGSKQYRPSDFLLRTRREQSLTDPQSQQAFLRGLAQRMHRRGNHRKPAG